MSRILKFQQRLKQFFKLGSAKLQSLDPFIDLHPSGRDAETLGNNFVFPEEGHHEVNERYEWDSDNDYVYDEERNAFDALQDMQLF